MVSTHDEAKARAHQASRGSEPRRHCTRQLAATHALTLTPGRAENPLKIDSPLAQLVQGPENLSLSAERPAACSIVY